VKDDFRVTLRDYPQRGCEPRAIVSEHHGRPKFCQTSESAANSLTASEYAGAMARRECPHTLPPSQQSVLDAVSRKNHQCLSTERPRSSSPRARLRTRTIASAYVTVCHWPSGPRCARKIRLDAWVAQYSSDP